MADSKKCAHELCNCIVPSGEKYCSTVCEDSKDVTTLECECNHAGCVAQQL
jgi:hypothetical protein